jgi:hypothetical protein
MTPKKSLSKTMTDGFNQVYNLGITHAIQTCNQNMIPGNTAVNDQIAKIIERLEALKKIGNEG